MKKDFELKPTTEGRQRFPNLLQNVYGGETTLIAFHRYGRVLGALVSLDAVRMLAGENVSEPARAKITKAAQNLLSTLENSN